MRVSDGGGSVATQSPPVKTATQPQKAAPPPAKPKADSISVADAAKKQSRVGDDKIVFGATLAEGLYRSLDLMCAKLSADGVGFAPAMCANFKAPFPSNPGGNSGVSPAGMTNTAVKGGKLFAGSDTSDGMKIVNALTNGLPGPVGDVAFIAGKGLAINEYDSTGLSKAQEAEYTKMSRSDRLGLVMQQLGPAGFAGFLGQMKAQAIGGDGGGPFTLPEGSQSLVQKAFQGLVDSGGMNAKDIDALAAGSGTLLAAGNFASGNGSADLSATTDLVSALHNDPKGLAFKNQFVAASYDSGNALSLAPGKSHPDAVSLLYAQGTNVLASAGPADIESFLQSKYASTDAANGPSSLEAIVNGSVRGEANVFKMSPDPGSAEVYTGTAALLEQIAGDAKGAPIGSGAASRATAAFNGVADATTKTDRFGLCDENDIVRADVAGSGLRVAASNLLQNAFPSILKSSFTNGDFNEIDPTHIRNFLQLAFTPQYANKGEAAQIGGAVGATLGGYLHDLEALGQTHDTAAFEKTYGTIFGPPSDNTSGGIETGNDPLQNGFGIFGQILGSAKTAMSALQSQIQSQKPANSNLSWTAAASLAANLALTVGSFGGPEITLGGDVTIDLAKVLNGVGNAFNTEQSASAFIAQINGQTPSGNVQWKNAPAGSATNLSNPILQWLFNAVQNGPAYLNRADKPEFDQGFTDQNF